MLSGVLIERFAIRSSSLDTFWNQNYPKDRTSVRKTLLRIDFQVMMCNKNNPSFSKLISLYEAWSCNSECSWQYIWVMEILTFLILSRSILESKGCVRLFRKSAKKVKIFEHLGKNVQNLKIFWKRTASCVRLSHAWNS